MEARLYRDGWLMATKQQKELQKPIVKAFLNRAYNNTIINMVVRTGLKEGRKGKK